MPPATADGVSAAPNLPKPADGKHVKLGYRGDIEGMRALAVLLVIAFHAGFRRISGGYIGVDVFLVLSGYLITGLLVKEHRVEGRIKLADFYARRVRRLLPASTVMLLGTLLASFLLFSPLERGSVIRTAMAFCAYASNVYFAFTARDYFSPEMASNPLLHTWSLAVEEQFYIFWPWVIMLAFRFRRSKVALMTLGVAITVVSFGASAYLTNRSQSMAFYLTPMRAWEFAVGGIACLITYRPAKPSWAIWLAGWAGLAAVLLSSVIFSASTPFPGYAALLPVAGTLLTLFAGAVEPGRGVARFFALKPMQIIGGLSYSVYLWHWPVLVFAQADGHKLSRTGKLVCVALSFLLAYVTQQLVENPMRKFKGLLGGPSRAIGYAVATSVVLIGALGAWSVHLKHSPQYMTYEAAVKDLPKLYSMNCETIFQQTKPQECTFGDTVNPVATVVLFGDSHAAQWSGALEKAAIKNHWKLVTMIKSSCPADAISAYNTSLQREEAQCAVWRGLALQRIVELKPAVVVMSSFSGYRQPAQPDLPITGEQWENGARQTLTFLNDHRIHTALMRDTPHAGLDVPRCLARDAWKGTANCTPLLRTTAINGPQAAAEERAAAGLANISILNLNDEICGPTHCDLVEDGMVVYRDDNHLTQRFAETLIPTIDAKLAPLLAAERGAGAL